MPSTSPLRVLLAICADGRLAKNYLVGLRRSTTSALIVAVRIEGTVTVCIRPKADVVLHGYNERFKRDA